MFPLDNGLSVESGKANENGLSPGESASISVPTSIISLIPNKENINVIFVVYNNTFLFPIRTRRRNSNQTSSQELAIGSQVIGFSVPGIPEGTELPDPVNISLRLANPRTGTLEVLHTALIFLLSRLLQNVTNPACVFWDFEAAGKSFKYFKLIYIFHSKEVEGTGLLVAAVQSSLTQASGLSHVNAIISPTLLV